jgi:hypothetical protein
LKVKTREILGERSSKDDGAIPNPTEEDDLNFLVRHCERSEAIHLATALIVKKISAFAQI